jgi:hypothetical protein
MTRRENTGKRSTPARWTRGEKGERKRELTLGEPESDLLEGVLNGVGSVADVSAHVDGVVASDGSRLGSEGVGSWKPGRQSIIESLHHTTPQERRIS